ncbi:hypothetical protein PG984_011210 [Apiospora sp. TS-2023a]
MAKSNQKKSGRKKPKVSTGAFIRLVQGGQLTDPLQHDNGSSKSLAPTAKGPNPYLQALEEKLDACLQQCNRTVGELHAALDGVKRLKKEVDGQNEEVVQLRMLIQQERSKSLAP